ncbi:MAG: hypothetical protein H0T15_06235 [Thermoleophilaceae bacterium]|nr:hypothetical protein [Thermoleophilaceae bacterium]
MTAPEQSPRGVRTEQASSEKPELLVLGAFAGGLVFAQLLKLFGGDS